MTMTSVRNLLNLCTSGIESLLFRDGRIITKTRNQSKLKWLHRVYRNISPELNYVLDRNTYVAKMMACELADQLPPVSGAEFNEQLPHTRASFQIPVS